MPLQKEIPATPRVISPSPTPSELSDGYRAPVTRSASARRHLSSPPPISEEKRQEDECGSDSSVEKRARTRSRSPTKTPSGKPRRRLSGLTPIRESPIKSEPIKKGFLSPNGHLSPYSKAKDPFRDLSRSPSPLGLIPLHKHYRNLIHRHEIPRKLLHVSIGFVCVDLYRRGVQPLEISPWLFTAFIPIAATDFLRHRFQTVNRFYIRCLGALMRETEVSGYNGVIWYLLGAYIVLRFFPKDIGVMGVLLLSWCDTAASTFGRLYGRYTPRIRRGKSLAGSLAACAVGVFTAAAFWGYLVPTVGYFANDPENSFMFSGTLNLIPDTVKGLLEWVGVSRDFTDKAVISGPLALGVMSLWTGVVAAGSELIDLFGWDDNLTIPVLSGVGMWGFLKVFGS
ncbi:Diacylglycerol kinase [Ophidiomyces ophidiicola]|nr:Diacylglycerol kinase [Ophidiomyces ophidiicola]